MWWRVDCVLVLLNKSSGGKSINAKRKENNSNNKNKSKNEIESEKHESISKRMKSDKTLHPDIHLQSASFPRHLASFEPLYLFAPSWLNYHHVRDQTNFNFQNIISRSI